MKHKVLGKVGSTGKVANNSDSDVFPLLPMSDMSNRLLRKEMTSTLYEYYLVDDIGEASDYIELCDVLRSASPNDEVLIRINSGGGSLATANMVVNAIRESQAHVHGFIESTCASAATLIYLACHSYSLSEDADMMVHTSSSLYGGKEHEQHSYVTFSRKKIHKMVRDRYTGFLTEKEIENVLNGQDYYFDSEDIAERLETYTEFQQKKFEAELEAFQKEQEDAIEGSASTKPKKKKILPS
jgi:ATP-dependent protease ClpP protease subunit